MKLSRTEKRLAKLAEGTKVVGKRLGVKVTDLVERDRALGRRVERRRREQAGRMRS